MQKGQSPILIIVGILVVGLIAGGAYYFGKISAPKPQTQAPVVTSQPIATPQSATSSSTETANWKTYTDTEHKLLFLYPPDWKYSVGITNYIIFSPVNFTRPSQSEDVAPVDVSFYRRSYADAILTFANTYDQPQDKEDISIAGLNGVHIWGTIGLGPAQGHSGGGFILNKDDKALEFSYEVIAGRNYMNEARKMIESLKFIQ